MFRREAVPLPLRNTPGRDDGDNRRHHRPDHRIPLTLETDVITTTLNAIRAHDPCESGWKKILKHLGKSKADDAPLPLLTILESNGIDDALWCTRAVDGYDALWRHFAVDCAERVLHLTADYWGKSVLIVARRHALGDATDDELAAAARAAERAAAERAAALAAAGAKSVAWDAERKWQAARFREMLIAEKWTPVDKEHGK